MKREVITLVKSRLFNPMRKKRVRTRTPIPLVNVSAPEIMEYLNSQPWEVLDKSEMSLSGIRGWIWWCRRDTQRWFPKPPSTLGLGWQWCEHYFGETGTCYWLEYSVIDPR